MAEGEGGPGAKGRGKGGDMAHFSFPSADELRVNTSYHQTNSGARRRGVLPVPHPHSTPVLAGMSPLWDRHTGRLWGGGSRCGCCRLWKPPRWEVATFPSARGPCVPAWWGFQGNRCSRLGRRELGGVWQELELGGWAGPRTGLGVSWALVSMYV